jgi:hypothetical protein
VILIVRVRLAHGDQSLIVHDVEFWAKFLAGEFFTGGFWNRDVRASVPVKHKLKRLTGNVIIIRKFGSFERSDSLIVVMRPKNLAIRFSFTTVVPRIFNNVVITFNLLLFVLSKVPEIEVTFLATCGSIAP